MRKLLVVLLIAWAGFHYRGIWSSWFGAPAAATEPAVVLYATEWCGYCRRARNFLRENGIPYVEYDIDKSEEGRSRYRALGGNGVPLLEINGRVVRGYNPDAIRAALR